MSIYSIKNVVSEPDHIGRYAREAENITDSEPEAKNCISPTFKEFPSDGLTHEQRQGGAVIIHILIVSSFYLECFGQESLLL